MEGMDGSIVEHYLLKYSLISRKFDYQISRNLRVGGIETRPVESNGLWCCVLLPTILIVYNTLYNVSQLYSLVAYVSVGLLCYSILFVIFISISCLVLKEAVYAGCIASSLVSALLVYTFLVNDLLFSLLTTLPSVFLFSTVLRVSLTMFPRTFTIGEAMIVTQGIVLFLVMALAKCLYMENEHGDLDLIGGIVFTVLSTVGLIVTALYLMIDEERTLLNLQYIFAAAIVYTLTVLYYTIGLDSIPKILCYVFLDPIRVKLFVFWLFLVVVSVIVIMLRTKLAVKAGTVTRKTFHILASLVFMSGILYDVNFTILASGGGLALLILVECLRKSGIEPISSELQAAFEVYSDEKDIGSFALTPIYLFVALSCPLLVVPCGDVSTLETLSGVLAIGVGDTAASWFGSKYGFNKWPECDKTLEGTVFNIISQVAVVYTLQMFELLQSPNGFLRTVLAATVTGLVEAKTDQVDNLVLPLVSILAYQVTSFMN